ncbi:hypothetical protein FACS1894204_08970 [Synergistales bacterium]|nr:hypothetical protein FACS1894204_08970 [Synergistales bacterium]
MGKRTTTKKTDGESIEPEVKEQVAEARKHTAKRTVKPRAPKTQAKESTAAAMPDSAPDTDHEKTADFSDETKFTLSDFIPHEVAINIEPVIKTEPKLTNPLPELESIFDIKTLPVAKTAPQLSEDLPEIESISDIKTELVIKKEPQSDEIPVNSAAEPDAKTQPVLKTIPLSKNIDYLSAEFTSVQVMSSLKGFAPLGMLFVLMDVLNGAEEGLVRVNRLSKALGIGKPAMLVQLDNLERAGLVRTISSSQRGRYIELLTPNRVFREAFQENRNEEPQLSLNVLPQWAPKNFSLSKLKDLHEFLTSHDIQVVSVPDEANMDPRLAQISAFLGKYLSYVEPFYKKLKTTLNAGEQLQFPLLGFQGREVTHTLNFCKMLKDVGFLASYAYRRAPLYTITARISRTPDAINFLSGGWLEHYIRDKVVSVLTTHPTTMDTPYAFMKNPRIILPGDEDFEFDFLLMAGDSVFWIEAKTGEYMEYISKYSRVAKLMGLERNNSLLVLVDSPEPESDISARFGISCCSVAEFSEVFRLAMVYSLTRSKRRR